MNRTDTLLRLKRFRVDETKRRIAAIDAMRSDLERKLADLDDNVAREKQRAGDSRRFEIRDEWTEALGRRAGDQQSAAAHLRGSRRELARFAATENNARGGSEFEMRHSE